MSKTDLTALIDIQGQILRADFESRRATNQQYSLRAYARKIGISPALLSRVLSGKSHLGVAAAQLVAARLTLDPQQLKVFVPERDSKKCWKPRRGPKPRELSSDTFDKIGDWKALAVYAAVSLPKFAGSLEKIANGLGLSVAETEKLLAALLQVDMISVEQGRYVDLIPQIRVSPHVKSKTAKERLAFAMMRNIKRAIHLGEDKPAICVSLRCRREDIGAVKERFLKCAHKVIADYGEAKEGLHDTVIQVFVGYAELTKDEERLH